MISLDDATVVFSSPVAGGYSVGAGVVIDASGSDVTVLTAAHVVAAGLATFVVTHDKTSGKIAKIVVTGAMATVTVHLPHAFAGAIAHRGGDVHDAAIVVGHPLGANGACAFFHHDDARFLAENGWTTRNGLSLIAAPAVTHGDSGGGVFDASGNLVGIVQGDGQLTDDAGHTTATGILVSTVAP